MTRQRRRGASGRRKHKDGWPRLCSEDDTCCRSSSPDFLPAMFRGFWILAAIVSASTAWLYILVRNAPVVSAADSEALRFPASLPELQRLAALLNKYYATNPGYVTLLFCSAYIYKQAFVIPGSALLNVLGGALFGVGRGFPLCCALTGAGASCCYALSATLGKEAVQRVFPTQVLYMQQEVEANKDRLVYLVLAMRLFPMSPNWLITIAAPVVGIPYHIFLGTVVVGLMPYNFVCVQAGEMLATLTSLHGLFSAGTLFKMALLALAVLGPSLLWRRGSRPDPPDPPATATAQ